jgi:hypothetical protein
MDRAESSFSKVCSKVYAVHLWVTNLADILSSSIPFILEVPINKIFGFVGSDCCFFLCHKISH